MNKKILSLLPAGPVPTAELPSRYILAVTLEKVSGVDVLCLSFYDQGRCDLRKENGKKKPTLESWKPQFKSFVWDKDYATLKLKEDGTYQWSNASLYNLLEWPGYFSDSPCITCACDYLEYRERIASFFKVKCPKTGEEINVIKSFQNKVMAERLAARHKKITDRIDKVMEKIQPLPKDFDSWVYNGPFDFSRYVYYKREGRVIHAFCTECKKSFEFSESKYTKEHVKHDHKGICPSCRRKVVFKAKGVVSKYLTDRTHFAIMQKYEDGVIVRYFKGSKEYREHYTAPKIHYHETAREIYKTKGKMLNVETYEYTYFLSTGHLRWCDGQGRCYIPSEPVIYGANIKDVLHGTPWQYSCLQLLVKKVKKINVESFLGEFLKRPGIEYLVKFGLYRLVSENVNSDGYPSWKGINFQGKGIKEIFGLEKHLFSQLQRLNLGVAGLKMMKAADAVGKVFSDCDLEWAEDNLDYNSFSELLKHTTPRQIIKYLKKQAGRDYVLSDVLTDWYDYVKQCKTLKFDLSSTFVLFPKDLREKHEEYTMMMDKDKLAGYNAEIAKAYESLFEQFAFSNEKFIIRPASSVGEIIAEGHRLRHCVASQCYVSKMAKGVGAIFLVRKVSEPETPFYTMELSLDRKIEIRQCRGYRNCSKTKDVNAFLDKWESKVLEPEEKKRLGKSA